jgi:hypothetical protein
MNSEELDKLKIVIEKSYLEIFESDSILGIYTQNFCQDPVCIIQLALGILWDKPLFFLIEKGTRIPKNFLRILKGYEFYDKNDEDSAKCAMLKLIRKAKKH